MNSENRMQIRMNKDLTQMYGSVFMGMNMRQCVFGFLAVASSTASYFALRNHLGTNGASLVAIIFAAFFGLLGFFKYNGMTAEKFFKAVILDTVLTPHQLGYHAVNFNFEYIKIINQRKEDEKNDKHHEKNKRGKRREIQSSEKRSGSLSDKNAL